MCLVKYLLSNRRLSLTSSVFVAKVGKPPNVAKANSVAHAGHDEVQLAHPGPSLREVIILLAGGSGTSLRETIQLVARRPLVGHARIKDAYGPRINYSTRAPHTLDRPTKPRTPQRCQLLLPPPVSSLTRPLFLVMPLWDRTLHSSISALITPYFATLQLMNGFSSSLTWSKNSIFSHPRLTKKILLMHGFPLRSLV